LILTGIDQDTMALIFSGSGCTPSAEMICPKNPIVFFPNEHLDSFASSWLLLSTSNTILKRFKCSWKEGLYTRISLKNIYDNKFPQIISKN